jgi:signal transduction histidine kinase
VPEGAVVEGDEVRLAQALDNLLDNAVRHGQPPITVAARASGDTVELRVIDGGRGVPGDLVPRLFDRYATSGAAGGSGLGLYLVREIVRGHGGDAGYEAPTDDSPTAFVVRLPRGPANP